MINTIQEMIEDIEKSGADKIEYCYEVEKEGNKYILTYGLMRKGVNYNDNN